MGKLEDILDIIRRYLHIPMMRFTIWYHVPQDTIDILFHHGFVIHQEHNTIMKPFFVMRPTNDQYTFIQDRENLIDNESMIIFPGKNVFHLLGVDLRGIEDPFEPEQYLEILGDLLWLTNDNLPKLSDLFSEKNIENTYNSLIKMKGNNDEAVQKIIRRYYAGEANIFDTYKKIKKQKENQKNRPGS